MRMSEAWPLDVRDQGKDEGEDEELFVPGRRLDCDCFQHRRHERHENVVTCGRTSGGGNR